MRILRIKSVVEKVGISRARIYKLEGQGRFPARLELGPNSVGWLEADLDTWIAARTRRGRSPRREDLQQAAGGRTA